jgi:AcrR family transcriptional regulator
MDKKAIQRRRVERYLIDAAKTIIRREGADAVTVRRVADLAGYSYTTMYNYFADLNTLLWYVVADLMDEMVSVVTAQEEKSAGGPRGLKDTYRAYMGYYLENPSVYRFAFYKQIGEPPPDVARKLTVPLLAQRQAAVLARLAEEGYLEPEKIAMVGEMITLTVHGLLLFYFSERTQITHEEMFGKMEQAIDLLLTKKNGETTE